MNSERIKQMEMENILAQGDIHSAIDLNKQQIENVVKQNNEILEQVEFLCIIQIFIVFNISFKNYWYYHHHHHF